MRIIPRGKLNEYFGKYRETKNQLEVWYYEVKEADWNNPQDVKEKYGSASIIGGNRVVFNIKGNNYRLVTKMNYQMKVVDIRFFGTHEEYNKINAEEI